MALAIAIVKAVLVILSSCTSGRARATKVVVVSGFFWLGILFTLTLSDFLSRAWLDALGK